MNHRLTESVVTCPVNLPGPGRARGEAAMQVTAQVAMQVTVQVEKVLRAISPSPKSRKELQVVTGLGNSAHFRKTYVEPLLAAGWLARTIPDKPNSHLQKYRITRAGQNALDGKRS